MWTNSSVTSARNAFWKAICAILTINLAAVFWDNCNILFRGIISGWKHHLPLGRQSPAGKPSHDNLCAYARDHPDEFNWVPDESPYDIYSDKKKATSKPKSMAKERIINQVYLFPLNKTVHSCLLILILSLLISLWVQPATGLV